MVFQTSEVPPPPIKIADGYHSQLPQYVYEVMEGIRRSHLEWIGYEPNWRPDRYRHHLEHPEESPTFAAAAYKCAYHCLVNEGLEAFLERYKVVERKTPALKEEFGEDNLLNGTEAQKLYRRKKALFDCDEIESLWALVIDHEVTVSWRCPHTGLKRKARIDWILDGRKQTICDLKLVKDISDKALSDAVAYNGYHRQAATYLQGMNVLGYDVRHFLFVFQEESAPYAVKILRLDDEAIKIGAEQVKQQMMLLQHCMASEDWPSPSEEGIKEISLPRWCAVEGE